VTGRKGWFRPRWVEVFCSEIEIEDSEMAEVVHGFSFKILDPLSLTPKSLEDVVKGEDDMAALEKFLPRIVKDHNFTSPETGEDLPQFQDDPEASKELPMFILRFISDKFLEMVNPDREVIPLVKEKV